MDREVAQYEQTVAQYETKNNRGNEMNDEDVQFSRIYEIPYK